MYYMPWGASKAAVKHFSEAMRRDMHEYPVHVMAVFPTVTDTDMMKTTNVENMDNPEEVAKASIEGLHSKEIEVIMGVKSEFNKFRQTGKNPIESL